MGLWVICSSLPRAYGSSLVLKIAWLSRGWAIFYSTANLPMVRPHRIVFNGNYFRIEMMSFKKLILNSSVHNLVIILVYFADSILECISLKKKKDCIDSIYHPNFVCKGQILWREEISIGFSNDLEPIGSQIFTWADEPVLRCITSQCVEMYEKSISYIKVTLLTCFTS